MPVVERQDLCSILDDNNIWSELAVTHMGYDKSIIQVCLKNCLISNSNNGMKEREINFLFIFK